MSFRFWITVGLASIADLVIAQQIPGDEELLRLISSNTNSNFKRLREPTFKISFKDITSIDDNRILLVACRSRNSSHQEHQLGWENYYYFKVINNGWGIMKSFESDSEVLLGDYDSMKIISIGKNKTALVSTFLSTGNRHLERKIFLSQITMDKLRPIGTIDLDYSNEAFLNIENISQGKGCPKLSYKSYIHVQESISDWWTIRINRLTKVYSDGCTELPPKMETVIYSFDGKKYLQLIDK
jgi:hypothetical protein